MLKKNLKLIVSNACLVGLLLVLTGCGFHLRHDNLLANDFKTLSLTSYDDYAQSIKELRKQFQRYKITEVPPASNITNIHILGESYTERTVSLYQNRVAAELEIKYVLRYQVTLPNKKPYTLTAGVTRVLLDDPAAALAKSVEEEALIGEMRTTATQEVMRQLAYVGHLDAKKADLTQQHEAAINAALNDNSDNVKSTKTTDKGVL